MQVCDALGVPLVVVPATDGVHCESSKCVSLGLLALQVSDAPGMPLVWCGVAN
jgi:hypothetical protein